jgi:hypothetical protein
MGPAVAPGHGGATKLGVGAEFKLRISLPFTRASDLCRSPNVGNGPPGLPGGPFLCPWIFGMSPTADRRPYPAEFPLLLGSWSGLAASSYERPFVSSADVANSPGPCPTPLTLRCTVSAVVSKTTVADRMRNGPTGYGPYGCKSGAPAHRAGNRTGTHCRQVRPPQVRPRQVRCR